MAKKDKAVRQMRAVELDAVREDLGPEIGDHFKRAMRLALAAPRLVAEIDRLKKELTSRDERLAAIAGATKKPVKKRAPRKPKEEPPTVDPAQVAIPGTVEATASDA